MRKSLLNNNKDSYAIHKVSDYYSEKYKTRLSQWKISGTVDMFNMHKIVESMMKKI